MPTPALPAPKKTTERYDERTRQSGEADEKGREMTRAKLAEQLRSRLREGGGIPPEILAGLDNVDDDFIVNSYLNTTCEDCGKKLGEGVDVEQVLAESRDLDDFFGLCMDAQGHTHAFAHFQWPKEL